MTPQFDNIGIEKTTVSAHLRTLGEEKKTLGEMNTLNQELYLIEDILFVMMSIEGNYIKRVPDPENSGYYIYAIEPNLNHSGCGNHLSSFPNI